MLGNIKTSSPLYIFGHISIYLIELSTMIQRILLLALISAPNFHDTRSGYLLVRLNSLTDGPDSMDPEPIEELTENSWNSIRPQGFRSLGTSKECKHNYNSYDPFNCSLGNLKKFCLKSSSLFMLQ